MIIGSKFSQRKKVRADKLLKDLGGEVRDATPIDSPKLVVYDLDGIIQNKYLAALIAVTRSRPIGANAFSRSEETYDRLHQNMRYFAVQYYKLDEWRK
jgi:hypothetical protein